MCECCNPKYAALTWLIVGLIFILNQVYFNWDMWIVIGSLLIIKAILLFVMPNTCTCCESKSKKK